MHFEAQLKPYRSTTSVSPVPVPVLTLLVLLYGLVVNGAYASNTVPETQLKLKPKLCIVRRGDDQCTTEVDVRWSSTQADTFCLFRQGKSTALECWNKDKLGQFADQLTTSKSMSYWLMWKSEQGDQEAGRAVLKVVNVIPEDRRRTRRRRHVWSVF